MHHNPLLALLDGVKQTGPDKYVARCPAHEDKTPSLAISIVDDGRILCHCYAGCDTGSIMGALGLSLADLFPDGPIDTRLKGAAPWIRPQRRAAEDKAEHHRLVMAAAQTARENGKRLTNAQMEEERVAFFALKEMRNHNEVV